MPRLIHRNRKTDILISVYLCIWLLTSCTTLPTEVPTPLPTKIAPTITSVGLNVPFEVIGQNYRGWGKNYPSTNPGFMIITKVDETNSLTGLVSNDDLNKIKNLDFEDTIAIAVFQGEKPTSGYSIVVDKVTAIGNTVSIWVILKSTPPNIKVNDVVTSPYQLIGIKASFKGEITFKLISENNVVVTIVKILR